jgi:non-ribosomal peptide synthetase-like protein
LTDILLEDDPRDGGVVAPARTRTAHDRPVRRPLAPRARSAPPARSLIDVFAATVSRCENRVALEASDATLTYAELSDVASEFGERLRARGIGPGDRVGVRVPSGTSRLYVAILGVLNAGAAYVPVDADDPPARATAVWESSGACAVITDGDDGLELVELAAPQGGGDELSPDDDAWVIFTSGSSGQPKGVAVTHRSAAAFVDAEAQLWTVHVEDRVLAGLSVGFDASCEEIWLAWRHGATLVPVPREVVRGGAELGPWLVERAVTVVSTVPTLAAMWEESDIAGVRLLILGGEACPEALAWRLAADREVWNTYGPTEATVVTTAARLTPGHAVTIGWPLSGWQVAVLGEDGEPVQLGETGELVISGVGLGRYLDPELDGRRFAAAPALAWPRAYRTGDIVRETIDGLEFLGRRDDQVKIGGRRIELGELDAQLSSVPGVRAAAAAVRKSAAGNPLLVGYVTGDVDAADVRAVLAERLPDGLVPLVVPLDSLPRASSGKVDRKALPWPPPPPRAPAGGAHADAADGGELAGTAAWLCKRWVEQLGPLPITLDSDFFELGGSSLAAAKLVSALRGRFPSAAVADVYAHRRLGELAARLDGLTASAGNDAPPPTRARRRWGLVQLAGVLALLALSSPQWLVSILAVDRWQGGVLGPQVAWVWLIAGWAVFGSPLGRAMLVVFARRLLLVRLRPGRYSRHSWLMCRIWFVERMAETFRLERLAGTPFAPRYARLSGHRVGADARLGTLPPATGLVSIGDGATLEGEVDIHGWWLEGSELVIGEVTIGAGARVGTRTLLMPNAEIGMGAEIEPGSVVSGSVPAGERWSGSPARSVGMAGSSWPNTVAPRPRARRFWRAMYGVGLAAQSLLPLAAIAPGLALLQILGFHHTDQGIVTALLTEAPLFAITFLLTYALLVALVVRAVSRLIRPGFHPDEGATGWAMWFSEAMMASARAVLFSLYSSIYTRPWLRLAGVRVGKRTEVSTAVGVNRLTSFGDTSFAADDVVFGAARARAGWLHVAPIEIGDRSFLGNGALLRGETTLGNDSLVGVLTTPPQATPSGTSWFGSPALELPRIPDRPDPSRTTSPRRSLIIARSLVELVRILLPATASVGLAALVFWALESIGLHLGIAAMVVAAPLLLLAAGLCAAALTVTIKWLVIGRYRSGEHPLWSFFVWRDEIINSAQEGLAGVWLLGSALGTPVMSIYLRAMGARVGRDVWCETLAITEFDLVELGDGCVVNRSACIETHLFHDRLMRIGPSTLGAGSTLGPSSAVLPDTVLGAGCSVGGRSVVLRGEELPPGTRWHGAPVVSV